MATGIKKRIGVVRGGSGKEYHASLRKGGDILSYLEENLSDKFKAYDILVDTDHVWHFMGLPVLPSDLSTRVDIVWNTGHPTLSNILRSAGIPVLGNSAFPAVLMGDHDTFREHIRGIGLNAPRRILLPVYQSDFDGPRQSYATKKASEIFEKFGAPWIVKAIGEEGGMGIHVAKTFPELVRAIADGVEHKVGILVEEFVAGKPAALHLLPDFRSEEKYVFPLGNASGLSQSEKEELVLRCRQLHAHVGAGSYMKADLLLTPRGKVYVLEVEEVPDLRAGSHLAESAASAGAKLESIVEHMLANVRL